MPGSGQLTAVRPGAAGLEWDRQAFAFLGPESQAVGRRDFPEVSPTLASWDSVHGVLAAGSCTLGSVSSELGRRKEPESRGSSGDRVCWVVT